MRFMISDAAPEDCEGMENQVMIQSKSNPLIKRVKRLLNDAHYRNEQREFIIEGTKIIHDALLTDAAERPSLNAIIYSSRFTTSRKAADLLKISSAEKTPLIEVSDSVMAFMGSLQTDQGIIAVANFIDRPFKEIIHKKPLQRRRRRSPKAGHDSPPLFVGACGIQEPGNIGALMRTADAGGATAFLVFDDCADIYNPKTVRGSMGSIFSIPFARGLKGTDVLLTMSRMGIRIMATASDGPHIYTDLDYDRPLLALFGSEGRGLPESYKPFVDAVVSIPMFGGAESLNVNASAALIIYERSRRWYAH